MLKIDLHMHSKEDREDNISYSAKQLIDKAADLSYDALSLTFHKRFFWKQDIVRYAKNKGITLIPGAELSIEGKDVLVYNLKKGDDKIKTFRELRELKKRRKELFIMAPHPYFYLSFCLEDKLEEHIDLFDAIEYCWFFTSYFNRNKKAEIIAKKHMLPLVATSDNHLLWNFGKNYNLIDTKDTKDIFKAIKEGKFKKHAKPRSIFTLIWHTICMFYNDFRAKKITVFG